MRTIASLMLMGLAVGCASTEQYVPFPDQSMVVEDDSKGRIYVIRDHSMGAALGYQVRDGNKPIGELGPDGMVCWERDPGRATVFCEEENVSQVDLMVQAGQAYYLRVDWAWGWFRARVRLEQLTDAEGKAIASNAELPEVVMDGS